MTARLFEQLEPRLVLAAVSAGDSVAAGLGDAVADRLLIKLREDVVGTLAFAAGSTEAGGMSAGLPATLSDLLATYATTTELQSPLFQIPDPAEGAAPPLSSQPTDAAAALDPAEPSSWQAQAEEIGLDRWFQIDLTPGVDMQAVLDAFQADAAVEVAEPDYFFRLNEQLDDASTAASGSSGSGAGGTTASDGSSSTMSVPSGGTDPGYAQQWHLDAVNAPEAWAHLESLGLPAGGASDIVVAVIDTGVDYTHPDLAANMWVNPLEVAANSTDDDGNGFVDDIHGVSVVSNTAAHSGNPLDDNGHGTHVAGIIAASANNGIGGTGVAFNARIMAIKSFGYSGTGASSDIAEGIYYAVENGADIINMSFGSYAESSLVKDALQVAFGTSVLVAAAGNDGRGNLSCPPDSNPPPADMFPAAYNWVLGVQASMAQPNVSTGSWLAPFSNYDCLPNDAHEYELLAPGAGVYSTVPNDGYSSWSGTSMATPVVSGIAALLRTKFADTDLYSSRFIMGQLAVGRGDVLDAERTLTDTPTPNLTYRDHLLFDTTIVDAGNDADGRVDAGETVDLAITIRNHWGRADNVTVLLEPIAAGAISPDPYVTMITDTVSYGAVGTFSEDDNGLIYTDGVITGVSNPFQFSVAADTPNDHTIPFRLTITATNSLDPADATVYSFEARFTMNVQRGRELPSVIAEDTTLTKDDFWIVSGPVLVPEGVTLRVDPGTEIQWGTTAPRDPYTDQRLPYIKVEGSLIAAGTYEEPVRLFPSEAFLEVHDGKLYYTNVRIYNTNGTVSLDFVEADSPEFSTSNYETRQTDWLTSITRSVIRGDNSRRGASLRWDSLQGTYVFWGGAPGFQYSAAEIRETILEVDGLRHFYLADKYSTYDTVLFGNVNDRYEPWEFGFNGITQNNVFLGGNITSGSVIEIHDSLAADTEAAATAIDRFSQNAILNPLWSPDLDDWLRVRSNLPRASYGGITNNYWGTNNPVLLEKLVIDQADDFNLGPLVLGAPTQPLVSTYPYVTGITVATAENVDAVTVGAETVTYTVTFNRDMDQTVQPQVNFGPAAPYTDYTISGDWVDARTWQGSFNVTPLTGDGYQLIRVAGAQAVDKPWLVTGNDVGRFRFEIVTSGTQSMNLQASGGEGKVDLSWTQDDFDLLAGYNIYRATSLDGTYTRVNTTIVPKEQTSFTDTSVAPAQTYYYKFRIVKTDSTESVDSNVASAAPVDTIAPVITHTAVTTSVPNTAITIRADVTDNLAVQSATLHYRAVGESTYATRAMTNTTGSRYSASLDAGVMTPPGIEYYLSGSDGVTTVYHGLAAQPHTITIADRPVVTTITPANGPSTGGTSVTIVGSNFKDGASVTIGGGVASDVVVVSSTQITATTPAGVPAHADVTVINPDQASHSLLGGFLYEADGALIALPTTTAESGSSIEIPITLSGASGLLSAEIVITFDEAVLDATSARVGALTTGWTLATNTAIDGQVTLSLANATSVSAAGTLAHVTFDVVGAPTTSSALTVSSATLNDGAIATQLTDGAVTVNEVYAISGLLKYFADNEPIDGASLFLEGKASLNTTSGLDGSYAFASLRGGDYTLAPDKQDDVAGITAYDAALVLQAVAGVSSLSANEQLAANVNRRDDVTALDAAYILQKAVGLIASSFPNAGTNWVFSPAQRAFTGLAADQASQHFTGVLLGDVSGNWAAANAAGGQGSSTQATASVLAIGTDEVRSAGGAAQLPVTITRNGASIYAADLTITYDPTKVSVASTPVTLGDAAAGMSLAVNADTPGILRIALASPTPIAADGTLLLLDLVADAGLTADVAVSFSTASLNEGRVTLSADDGAVVIDNSIVVGEGEESTDTSTRTGNYRLVKRGKGRLILNLPNTHSGGTVIEEGEVVVRHITALGTGRLEVRTGAVVTLDLHTDRATVGSIDLSSGGHVDVGLGGLQIPAGSYDLDAIRAGILAARNGGSWDGAGIGSSTLSGFGSGRQVGYRVASDGTLSIAWAANGDATLDGRIDSRDINALLLSGRFNTAATDGHWYQGDFTFDGRVNSLDISRLLLTGLMNTGSYLPARGQGSGSSTSSLGSSGGSAAGASTGSGSNTQGGSSSSATSSVVGPTPPADHQSGERTVLVRPTTAGSSDATELAFAAIAVADKGTNDKANDLLERP